MGRFSKSLEWSQVGVGVEEWRKVHLERIFSHHPKKHEK
jgi:hypothetical protein